jgi:hypothetical protein
MKAYGLEKKIRLNLVDNHPPKGWVNWWEAEWGHIKKGAERLRAKQEIKKEVNEHIGE